MAPSQRRGVITLIPKEDSDLSSLANWRPITLLNADYKIVSKVITKRREKVLTFLINPDQTGFIKGRYIGQNIRLINDILEQTKLRNIPGILLQLDFRKTFDTIEWEFIQGTIALFNFKGKHSTLDFHILCQHRECSSKQWLLHKLFSLVKRSETRLPSISVSIYLGRGITSVQNQAR